MYPASFHYHECSFPDLIVDQLDLRFRCNLLSVIRPSLSLVTMSSDAGFPSCLLEFGILLVAALKVPQRRTRTNIAAENPGLNPPGKYSKALVAHESSLRDRKHVVEILE
jgi:hypothetical protein